MLRPVQRPASVFTPFAKGKQQAVTPHDGRSVVWGRGPASPAGPVGAASTPPPLPKLLQPQRTGPRYRLAALFGAGVAIKYVALNYMHFVYFAGLYLSPPALGQ